jgi:homogentisate 1,2-dioxygenase
MEVAMIPHVKGRVALQAHVDVPEGLCEEEFARSGFFGRYAHLYRSAPPVAWTRIEGPLKPRAFDFGGERVARGDYLASRRPLLANADVALAFVRLSEAMPYYVRNADGDDVLFVHAGRGVLETDFGPLVYRKGDYLVIPRGTVYRLSPEAETALLVIEAYSEVRLPDKGMLGQHALFDPALLVVPTPDPEGRYAMAGQDEYELRIKRNGELTSVFYPFNPINTVGWKGTLSVWQLNVEDIRPVISERYHLPPSAHTTFVADGFVICTFLPRGLETGDPKAMKVPFYHSNIDYDEVLFYHDGNFFSREGITSGMLTFHPQGIHHGPQQAAVERSKQATRTDEVAVMVDTRRPLEVAAEAVLHELGDYWRSWS